MIKISTPKSERFAVFDRLSSNSLFALYSYVFFNDDQAEI
jgi:hypothetical protein